MMSSDFSYEKSELLLVVGVVVVVVLDVVVVVGCVICQMKLRHNIQTTNDKKIDGVIEFSRCLDCGGVAYMFVCASGHCVLHVQIEKILSGLTQIKNIT